MAIQESDQPRADIETRARYAAAKNRMYDTGAVGFMEKITPLLPGVTLRVDDIVDSKGNLRQPFVSLEGHPETKKVQGETGIHGKIIAVTTQRAIIICPSLFRPDLDVVVTKSTIEEFNNGEKSSGHSRIWGTTLFNSQQLPKHILALSISEGVRNMMPPNTDLTAVRSILLPPELAKRNQ